MSRWPAPPNATDAEPGGVPVGPISVGPDDIARAEARYATMARIRAFELAVGERFRGGDVHGFVHTSIGQEACAAGVVATLGPDDRFTTTHRGHGHCLARGADSTAMMAELFGRETGSCRGRGGSMHLAQADLGILGANGVVGAGIPIAVGAGLAAQHADSGGIAVAFFGEGAVHTGAFHEAIGLAVAWQLPVLLACENNRFAEFTPSDHAWRGPSLVDRASSYGLPAETLDGNDVLAVEDRARALGDRARSGGGPAFLELVTYRIGGHYEGDATPYRPDDEVDRWRGGAPPRPPRARVGGRAAARERSSAVDALDAAADAEIAAAVETALAAPYPDPSTVLEHVRG